MRNVTLYINGSKVDLNDKSFILFNYTMNDLSNPTIVKNSFSKQITLEGTPNNNKLFGDIFRLDWQFSSMTRFNPLAKVPFSIYDDKGELIESGYMKMDSITNESGVVKYGITLYGGLGDFLYNLSTDADGNKRTLYDLKWKFYDGTEKQLGSMSLTASSLINEWWKYLEEGTSVLSSDMFCDILNFAPAYNGLPDKFDANKILVDSFFANTMPDIIGDPAYYLKKSGCSSYLVTMAKSHTEWELRNIIPYLQRPVFRVKAFLDAIKIWSRDQGYTFSLDGTFFSSLNPVYNNAWITLPLINVEQRNSTNLAEVILKTSLTPTDYLLGIVKSLGLSIMYDPQGKTISLMSRNSFFLNTTIDISRRLDASSKSITPLLTSSKWYQFGGQPIGEEVSRYKADYNVGYGCQRVDTGYDFNSEVSDLTSGITLKEAADVTEKNYLFASYTKPYKGTSAEALGVVQYEKTQIQMYNSSGEKKDLDVNDRAISIEGFYSGDALSFQDWLPKLQLHGADNKAEDGSNILVLFDGVKETPYSQELSYPVRYYVADDHPDIDALNSGKPCWNFDAKRILALTKLPSFRRRAGDYLMDWGHSREDFTNDGVFEDLSNVKSLYERYWKAYISDMYSVNTRVVKCKVNLSGLDVGQQLLRNFYWFDNAIWILNKIENYSITTDDLTDCEFIKVGDMDNYGSGQII